MCSYNQTPVLPVFSRNRPANPLCATFMSAPVGVDSKWFTGNPSFLEFAFTGNTGVVFRLAFCSALCLRASVATPSVPLQRKAFGATIRKGTEFLHDPRKQVRSPRCLRLMSGHRGQLDGVPDLPRFSRGCKSTVLGFRVCTYKP